MIAGLSVKAKHTIDTYFKRPTNGCNKLTHTAHSLDQFIRYMISIADVAKGNMWVSLRAKFAMQFMFSSKGVTKIDDILCCTRIREDSKE